MISENPQFEMIHISMDEDTESATKWAAKESFPWLTVLPEDASEAGLMTLFPDEGVPEYMIVKSSGEMVLTASSEAIFEKIKELTKEKN